MKYAVIQNDANVVVNVIECDDDSFQPGYQLSLVTWDAPCDLGSTWDPDTNTFSAPPVLTPPIPASITRRQGRLALYGADLLDAVEKAVASGSVPTQIWYADAPTWERRDPVVVALASDLGLDDAHVDQLFITASGL